MFEMTASAWLLPLAALFSAVFPLPLYRGVAPQTFHLYMRNWSQCVFYSIHYMVRDRTLSFLAIIRVFPKVHHAA